MATTSVPSFHHQNNNNHNNNNDPDHLRPTEAQLRWAQFHFKRRSKEVRENVDLMYQTPLNAEDVEGALPEDGNSTTSSEVEEDGAVAAKIRRSIKARRPKVSKGRRALLRVSRRTKYKRQQEIDQYGYRGGGGNINTTDEEAEEEEAEEDALNEIFMMGTRQRRRLRNRRGYNRGGGMAKDKESYKRFQAALHAMMMSIAASATPTHDIEVPTKKWTRTADHIAAASLYDEYLDPKWGIRRRPQQEQHINMDELQNNINASSFPLDRAASWLVHLPKVVGGSRENPYYNNLSQVHVGVTADGYEARSETSTSTLAMRAPGQSKFNQLVALVQQRMIQMAEEEEFKPGTAPKMKLGDFTVLNYDNDDNDYEGMIQQQQQQQIVGRRQQRRTNYIPRMRLRDFLSEGETSMVAEEPSAGGTPSSSGIPKMKLREFEAARKQEPRRLSKAMEIAKSLEQEVQNNDYSKTKQMVKSLEGDKTPKMKLRNFDFGQQEGYCDEKKVSEGDPSTAPPKRKPHRLSDLFLSTPQVQGQRSRPSPVGPLTAAQSEFLTRSSTQSAEDNSRIFTPSSGVSGFFSQVRRMNAKDAINAGSSRVTEYFSKPQQQQQQQQQDSSQGQISNQQSPARNSDFFDQVRKMKSTHMEGQQMLRQNGREDDFAAATVSNSEGVTGNGGVQIQAEGSKPEKANNSDTGMWSRGRNSFNSIASKLNSFSAGSPIVVDSTLTPRTSASTPSGNMKQAAANVSGIVGGFFQTMRPDSNATNKRYHESNPVPMSPYAEEEDGRNSETDFAALAEYRKSKRESISLHDDRSSLSSYQTLPENIREMVKSKIGSSPASDSRQHRASSAITNAVGRNSSGSQLSAKFSTPSRPNSSAVSRTTIEDNLSPEKYRQLHESVIQGYAESEKSIIDTDETASDISGSGGGMHPEVLASMMLSPDLLTKRHHQAIRAIEIRSWDQVGYLINANPWLVEMCELTTNQYLLHKIAFYGGGDPCAPEELCTQMIEKFPAAMHKFDRDGNVPLHLAAAAGHLKMIKMLGERFESGASIRNEDGMLPLHFAIASYGAIAGEIGRHDGDDNDDNPSPIRVIKTVVKLFPQGVVIADNDGNLPIHVAVECLESDMGIDVVYLLLDEADRQLQDPFGARFRQKVNLEMIDDDMSVATMSTLREMDSVNADGDVYCNAVKNNFDETTLLSAIHHQKGWGIIEALVSSGPGGRVSALIEDADKNNALHLLVGDYQDPAAAMSILKIVPETASKRNAQGMLPIEVACMQFMPDEVILAIALVDLPFDIEDKEAMKISKDSGSSWWFLVCECDDDHFEIVANLLSICTFQQRRALASMEGRSSEHKGTVLTSATPRCRQLLSQGLRFIGRFEFMNGTPIYSDPSIGLQEFDALDFGGDLSSGPNGEDGRKVILKCYTKRDPFLSETATLRELDIDSSYTEEVSTFGVGEGLRSEESTGQQYCMSIEYPQLTLDRVVDGMIQKGRYVHDANLQKKYAAKICYVLRAIAKALNHLHEAGALHGNVCLDNCGRYEQSWKLRGRLGLTKIGENFDTSRFHQSFPPEVLQVDDQEGKICDSDDTPVSFRSGITASPAMDIWAFGKLAYEAIVGQPMISFDTSKKTKEDVVSLLEILEWDESNMRLVFENLLDSGLPESGADLITSCLFAKPEDRPTSMYQILDNPFWKEMRRYREQTKKMRRHQEDGASSVYTETTKSIYTTDMSEI